MWQLGVRQMRARPGRAVLTMLSVVIGVAGVVAVTTATSATHHAYADMYAAMSGRAAIEIVSERGGTCPYSVVEEIENVSGVQTAAPVVQRPSSLYFGESRTDAVILGVDPNRNQSLQDYQLQSGASLEQEDGALLDESFAESARVCVGDEIKVFTRSGMRRLKVTGLLAPRSVAAARQGGTVWVRLDRAQQIFRLDEGIDAIQVLIEEGADEVDVEHRISQILPPGVVVRHPEARSRQVKDRMLSAQLGLNVGCAYTVLAAAFIILNTFVMNVTERRRQLGILRAIGATQVQVTQLLMGEGLLMGLLGTLIGLGAGLVGASALIRAMEELFRAPLPALRISGLSLGMGLLAGIGISMIATYFPAVRAARIPPVEAMRRGPTASLSGGGMRTMVLIGAPLAIFGLLGTTAALTGWVRISLVAPAGLAMLTALILLIPTVLQPLLRFVAAAIVRLLGIEGKIAHGQLLRWRVRTALTIGVVFVALSTGIGLGNSILSNVADVRAWYRQTLSADFFVRAMHPSMVTGTATEMPDSVRLNVEKISGVTLVDSLRFVRSTANDEPVLIVARELSKYPQLPLDIKEGDKSQIQQALREGQVVLGTVLAHRLKLHPGDEVEVGTDQGPRRLLVAGVATDYNVGGMMLYMERAAAAKLMQISGADVLLVRCDEAAREEVQTALRELCREGLILQSFAELGRLIDRIMGGVEAGLWAILSLQFLVAGFGIANTLTMNVLEQTREIGLLRVVAMTRRQVRRMIFAQAGLIGLVAVALGVPGGLMVGWILHLCTQPLTGQPIDFVLHPWLFLGGPILALAIVIAAAWLPAERAVRLEPGEALAYE